MKNLFLGAATSFLGAASNLFPGGFKFDKEKNFKKLMKKRFLNVYMSSDNLEEKQNTSTLVISCVDFRIRDEIDRLMSQHFQLRDDYDEVSLPGASLALVFDGKEHWSHTIVDIIEILKKLHGIIRIIFIDHRGCGAYNLAKGPEHARTRENEFAEHRQVMLKAKQKIQDALPELELEIYGLLMGLDGKVENMMIHEDPEIRHDCAIEHATSPIA